MRGLRLKLFTVALMLLSGVACSELLEFADWTIPVPEGTRVIEYADVSNEVREGQRIELVEDLVIGPRGDDDNYALFRPRHVGVDTRGNIYVLDEGNTRIQAYDANGEYVRTLGAAGSGPGEFQPGRGGFVQIDMAIAGDRIVAYDGAQARLSAWDSDGAHLGDHVLTGRRLVRFVRGLEDGSLVAWVVERTDDGSMDAVIRISNIGDPQRDYLSLPSADNFMVGRIGLSSPTGGVVYAAGADGAVYATAGDEYQVLAFGPDAATRWALRVAHERTPFTAEDRTRVVNQLTENVPNLDASGTDWPSHLGSISHLAVDGHGHLYVFGFPPWFAPPPAEIEVDVYAPDGERLFSGTMPPLRWTDAADDFVYAIRSNVDTEEREPVRYRLIEPFE